MWAATVVGQTSELRDSRRTLSLVGDRTALFDCETRSSDQQLIPDAFIMNTRPGPSWT